MKCKYLNCWTIIIVIFYIITARMVFGQTSEQIYQSGKKAFEENKYLQAVKSLYAYKMLLKNNINESIKTLVDDAIEYCDNEIDLAIRTKKQIDEKGNVTEVVVVSSGKVDDFGKEERKKFDKPRGKNIKKPNLLDNINANNNTDSKEVEKIDYKNYSVVEFNNKKEELLNNDLSKNDAKNENCTEIKEKYLKLLEKYNSLLEKYGNN